MKNPIQPKIIPPITLGCGILGLILQAVLLLTGIDEKGLYVTGHFADILSWFLSAVTLGFLALGIRDLGGALKYERLFPASTAGAIGCFAGAAGLSLASVRTLLSAAGPFNTVAAVAGFAAVICLAVQGHYRRKGQHLHVYFHIPVMLFFALHALCQYRAWSAATQLQEYAFPLLSSAFLILAVYHRAALEVKLEGRRWFVFFCHGAAFFCMLSIPKDLFHYLPLAVWMLTDCCTLRILQKRAKSQQPDTDTEG